MSLSRRTYRNAPTESTTFYPRLAGTHGAVASHHHLSANAAVDVLKAGGNAVDAAVAATFVEGVVNPQMHTIGGECPMLIKMADRGRVVAVNGNCAAPAHATPEFYRERGLRDVPAEGVLAAGVPAALGALLTALAEFGRMSFADVVAPALELARDGFPVSTGLRTQERYGLRDLETTFRERWPGSFALYFPERRLVDEGDLLRNPALAAVYGELVSCERRALQAHARDRRAGLRAVYDAFYRGDVASEIARFSEANGGALTRDDLERFETRLEAPCETAFGDARLFKCGPWTQGPVVLQALTILKPFDLGAMGHNSAEYLHHLIEAVKLAWADREQFYGDPEFVDVPIATLLSDGYGRRRAELIDRRAASGELRPGDPRRDVPLLPEAERFAPAAWGPGTVHVDVADRDGNLVAATPSGAWLRSSEVIPALGFPLTVRLMTFYLAPADHPNVVAPFKRPRTTLSPSLAFRRGAPWMAFGSMGGDQQDQWQLQFFLNRAVFEMPIQDAIEAPKFSSEHFPGFFAPHDAVRNLVRIEPRIDETVRAELARRGHVVDVAPDWTEGFLGAVGHEQHERSGETLLSAGCDPRGSKSEVFPAFAVCW